MLNRPERRNAFTITTVNEWADALAAAQHDELIRAIVVSGTGGSFCSGVDLAELKGAERTPLQEKRLLMDNVHRVASTPEAVDKPVIGAVDGAAVGAGMDMALMCDLRFPSPPARFSEGYIKVGLVPGDGEPGFCRGSSDVRPLSGCSGPATSSMPTRRPARYRGTGRAR